MNKPTKLNLQDLEFKKTIGRQQFVFVKLGKNLKTNKLVAIKCYIKKDLLVNKQADHIYSEYQLHFNLNHPFIATCDGYTQDDKYFMIITEFLNGGDLFSQIRQKKNLQLLQSQFYAAQVVLILEYMHSKKIAYRNLKPENLLIGADGYLKLTDFIFTKQIENRSYTICGTNEYMAPEVILKKGHHWAVDWWALGILIYEMSCGFDPFYDEDPFIIYSKICKGKVTFPRFIDKDAASIIKHLIQVDLSKRYGNLKHGANDIKQHRYFYKINWDGLNLKKLNPPFIPIIKNNNDLSNFQEYQESKDEILPILPKEDIFLNW